MRKSKLMKKFKRISYLLTIFSMLFIAFQIDGYNINATELRDASNHQQVEVNVESFDSLNSTEVNNEEEDIENLTITYDQVVELTDQFMEILVQEIDHNNKVLNYDTKDALLESFRSVASKEIGETYIDFYYNETTEGLYVIPTEIPPRFNKKNDYNMIQLNNKQVKVIQENQSDLYGNHQIEYEFSFDDGWKITGITHS